MSVNEGVDGGGVRFCAGGCFARRVGCVRCGTSQVSQVGQESRYVARTLSICARRICLRNVRFLRGNIFGNARDWVCSRSH